MHPSNLPVGAWVSDTPSHPHLSGVEQCRGSQQQQLRPAADGDGKDDPPGTAAASMTCLPTTDVVAMSAYCDDAMPTLSSSPQPNVSSSRSSAKNGLLDSGASEIALESFPSKLFGDLPADPSAFTQAVWMPLCERRTLVRGRPLSDDPAGLAGSSERVEGTDEELISISPVSAADAPGVEAACAVGSADEKTVDEADIAAGASSSLAAAAAAGGVEGAPCVTNDEGNSSLAAPMPLPAIVHHLPKLSSGSSVKSSQEGQKVPTFKSLSCLADDRIHSPELDRQREMAFALGEEEPGYAFSFRMRSNIAFSSC